MENKAKIMLQIKKTKKRMRYQIKDIFTPDNDKVLTRKGKR